MPSWSAALIEEARIKSLPRTAKELLMAAPAADPAQRSEGWEGSEGSEGSEASEDPAR